ncbi:MAG: 30S ribosomal protein S16 [Vampirovibrio sp.]|nr:30S ribosomal protein S16 [Vampirovibrio sp.]
MVKIRLKRLGRKKRPFYRIVVTDIRARRDCAPIEELGYYNPLTKDLKLNKTQALDWVSKGAQPSDKVKWLIDKAPESGELIRLELVRKERLSKKAKAKADEDKPAEEAAPAAAEEPKTEEPAAVEAAAPAAEAEEAPAE